jgi:hypothetical protein
MYLHFHGMRNRSGGFRKIDRPVAQDLATMVHEQGDIVDSIESNIEAASVQVHQGTDQLRQVRFFELCFLLFSKLQCPSSKSAIQLDELVAN